MSFKKLLVIFSSIVLLAVAKAAFAKDTLQVKVNQGSPAIQSLSEGGTPLAQGTYSSSAAIKVNYNLVAPSFSSQTFGNFVVGLNIEASTSTPATNYPLNVTLSQPGTDQNLLLSASPASFNSLSAAGVVGNSTITIVISCTSASPCPTGNGSTITGNLQFSSAKTSGTGSTQLDTSVKVQVNITLVVPAAACVQLYNFLTDQTLIYPANSTQVVWVKNGVNAGKVTSTTPFGQFSDNVMVANTCTDSATKSFDLGITLDPGFETNPNDNPGNAVFTYLATQIVDPSTFNISNFAVQTAKGQALCLQNITLPTNNSFLATVHMGIQRGIQTLDLDLDGDGNFDFWAQIFPAGSGCSVPTGEPTALLPFTLK